MKVEIEFVSHIVGSSIETIKQMYEDWQRLKRDGLPIEIQNCGNCKHFVSYRDEYQDNLESSEYGYCKHPNKKPFHTSIENVCEYHQEI